LGGIRRQDGPKSRLGECAEILISARHSGDNRDPLLFARIFWNVAALIETSDGAVCTGDTGNDGCKLKVIVRHVDRDNAVWFELLEIDCHRLLSQEVYWYCGADEGIDED